MISVQANVALQHMQCFTYSRLCPKSTVCTKQGFWIFFTLEKQKIKAKNKRQTKLEQEHSVNWLHGTGHSYLLKVIQRVQVITLLHSHVMEKQCEFLK